MDRIEQFTKPIEGMSTLEQRLKSWQDSFTDPNRHDTKKYTYLVHGLASPIGRVIQTIARIDNKLGNQGTDKVDLERNPDQISQRERISASVIDERRRATWGDAGLIIASPPDNIKGIYASDAGTPWYEGVSSKSFELPCTVEELLDQTSPGQYNEIVLTGNTEAGKVRLLGFFVNVFADRELVDPEMARKIKLLAQRLKLPLIEIVDQSPRMSSTQEKYSKYLQEKGIRPYNGVIDLKIDIPDMK